MLQMVFLFPVKYARRENLVVGVETLTCAFKHAKIPVCLAGWDPGSGGHKTDAYSVVFFQELSKYILHVEKDVHTWQAQPCFDGLILFNFEYYSKDSADRFAKQILYTKESYTSVDCSIILYTDMGDSGMYIRCYFFRLIIFG